MIKLRPHHLLCIEFFEGKGYDTKHIENMFSAQDAAERIEDLYNE